MNTCFNTPSIVRAVAALAACATTAAVFGAVVAIAEPQRSAPWALASAPDFAAAGTGAAVIVVVATSTRSAAAN